MELDGKSVMERLAALPITSTEAEGEAAKHETLAEFAKLHVRELRESLELAELNATLTVGGKNADERKKLEALACSQSEEVQELKRAINNEERRQAEQAGDAAQAKARRNAMQFELKSLGEIAGLMRAKIDLERAKIDKETALANLEAVRIMESVCKRSKTNG